MNIKILVRFLRSGNCIRVFVLCGISALATSSCWIYESSQTGRQVRTNADFQTISKKILLAAREEGFGGSKEELQEIVDSVAGGEDAWGRRIILVVQKEGRDPVYLLISPGGDGEMDVEDVEEYLSLRPVRVTGELSSDIVYRNGEAIKGAWK